MFVLPMLVCLLVKITWTICCVSDGMTNGCSIPLNISFPYKSVFHPACQRHDVCYSCGAAHGWTRLDCDIGFYNDMINECVSTDGQFRKKRDIEDFIPLLKHKLKRDLANEDPLYDIWDSVCNFVAGLYYSAVRVFGANHYDTVPPTACIHPCVLQKGRPNLS